MNDKNIINHPQYKVFQKLQQINPNILLSGSLILVKYGLIKRQVEDLDIVVSKSDEGFVKFCENLSILSPVPKESKYSDYNENPDLNHVHVRFMMDGVKVCVFIWEEFIFYTHIKQDNTNEVKISHILNMKKSYVENWKLRNWENPNSSLSHPVLKNMKSMPPSIQKHNNDIKCCIESLNKLKEQFQELKNLINNIGKI